VSDRRFDTCTLNADRSEVNERLAIGVEHVITRITDQEADELSPAPRDAGTSHEEGQRTADAG
jgi:hypothetical protein